MTLKLRLCWSESSSLEDQEHRGGALGEEVRAPAGAAAWPRASSAIPEHAAVCVGWREHLVPWLQTAWTHTRKGCRFPAGLESSG